jgi:hypothetical protein
VEWIIADVVQGMAVWNISTPSWSNLSVNNQWEVEFGVIPDGQYHVYYVPLFPFKLPTPAVQLNLTQMRLRPLKFGLQGQAVKIDWIRVVRGQAQYTHVNHLQHSAVLREMYCACTVLLCFAHEQSMCFAVQILSVISTSP